MSGKIIIDTDAFSIIIDRRARHEDYSSCLVGRIPILSFVTIAELRFGAAKAGWGPRRVTDLEEKIRPYVVVPYDDRLPVVWGQLRAQAQKMGHPLCHDDQIHDLWIAATAILHGAKLLTGNVRHFEGFPGLDLITP